MSVRFFGVSIGRSLEYWGKRTPMVNYGDVQALRDIHRTGLAKENNLRDRRYYRLHAIGSNQSFPLPRFRKTDWQTETTKILQSRGLKTLLQGIP